MNSKTFVLFICHPYPPEAVRKFSGFRVFLSDFESLSIISFPHHELLMMTDAELRPDAVFIWDAKFKQPTRASLETIVEKLTGKVFLFPGTEPETGPTQGLAMKTGKETLAEAFVILRELMQSIKAEPPGDNQSNS